mmetsp:Transcript_8189/g.9893  ORF Transcript_8189/g.9893 Transcript_8189/m.9893 type:complete len:105 (+) Transcript_8189:974-1288(+)
MLEASNTALKAQYFELTGGVDLETAAQRRAEKAVMDLGKLADREARLFAASAAAEEYIKQDSDYRHQIDKLEKAMSSLGDKYSGKPNKYLSGSIEKAKRILQQY